LFWMEFSGSPAPERSGATRTDISANGRRSIDSSGAGRSPDCGSSCLKP
jgi:hypothetical protein